MAYVASKSVVARNEGSFLSGLVARFRDAMERRAVYQRTLSELEQLSDRDLTDLSLHRSELHALAREAAYGLKKSV